MMALRPKIPAAFAALIILFMAQQVEAGDPIRELRSLEVGLVYVDRARVLAARINDHTHKTLVVDFKEPMAALSTLEGFKEVIRVGNHYVPYPAWSSLGQAPVPDLLITFWRSVGLDPAQGAMLITGADMDNLALARESEKGLTAVALVTAGVKGNAMRLAADEGRYVEPGTINALILTNRRLSPRAMTRALVTATEAKSAALQDLDIRSSYQPRLQATGTGTDNLIIIQGRGAPAELTGGHSKLGQLIARAIYRGVTRAIAGQNGITAGRGIIERLKERKISLAIPGRSSQAGYAALARKLADRPETAAWLEYSLALDDAWQRGWLSSLAAHYQSCSAQAARLGAGGFAPAARRPGPLEASMEVIKAWLIKSASPR